MHRLAKGKGFSITPNGPSQVNASLQRHCAGNVGMTRTHDLFTDGEAFIQQHLCLLISANLHRPVSEHCRTVRYMRVILMQQFTVEI